MGKFFKSMFKGLAHLVALFFKIIYNILKRLNIRVLTLYLIVCAIVQLAFKPFEGEGVAWFWTGFVLCCMITVVAWIVFFTRMRRVKERKRAAKEEGDAAGAPVAKEEAQPQEPAPKSEPPPKSEPQPQDFPAPERPHYFAVEGHDDYYFAEYADRYELYKREEDGDFHVRTDYKRSNV